MEEDELARSTRSACAQPARRRGRRPRSPDLILTGLQSDDLGYGQTGVVLAELLGLPHATIIMQVEAQRRRGIRVKRELEDGWFQHIEMPLPAVLDDSIRHQQAALRHADGHQESQDEGSQARHRRGAGR